jgi:hypothetical protein
VCEYVAATRGTESLWRLMRTFTRERDDVVSDADAAAVVRRELGVAPSRLVADTLAWIAAG